MVQPLWKEDSLAVSYKAKHTLNIRSSNCTPWYLPKWVENVHTKTCNQARWISSRDLFSTVNHMSMTMYIVIIVNSIVHLKFVKRVYWILRVLITIKKILRIKKKKTSPECLLAGFLITVKTWEMSFNRLNG